MTTLPKFRVSLPTAADFFRTTAVIWFLCSATQAWSDSTLTLDTGISATVTLSGAGNSCTGNAAAALSPVNSYTIPTSCGATITATRGATDSSAKLCKLATCRSGDPCPPPAPCGNAVNGGRTANLSLPSVNGYLTVGWVTATTSTQTTQTAPMLIKLAPSCLDNVITVCTVPSGPWCKNRTDAMTYRSGQRLIFKVSSKGPAKVTARIGTGEGTTFKFTPETLTSMPSERTLAYTIPPTCYRQAGCEQNLAFLYQPANSDYVVMNCTIKYQ